MSATTPAPEASPTGGPDATPTESPVGGPTYTAMKPSDERTWAMLAHLGSFVAAYVALGLIAPLLVLLLKGNDSVYVRTHAVESLNFQITALIAALACIPFMIILIGFPMLAVVGVLYLIWVIQASMAANRGEYYRYPVNWRLVK